MVGGGVASLLAACQSAPARAVPTPVNPLIKPKPEGNGVVALQASSELAVGRNRFALGLVDARNQPMTSGMVQVEFFKLKADGTGEKRAESPALFRSVDGFEARTKAWSSTNQEGVREIVWPRGVVIGGSSVLAAAKPSIGSGRIAAGPGGGRR